jgi:hypothetical protein
MEAVDALTIAQWQFRVAWSLARDVQLPRLTTPMCLWQPHDRSWTVRQGDDGSWWPDWQEPDPVDPPPPSIGWLTWHLSWWWSSALAIVQGGRATDRSQVPWAGSAERAVATLIELADAWADALAGLDAAAMSAPTAYPWPSPRPLAYTVSWVNLELMKNVAEIGEVANLYVNR